MENLLNWIVENQTLVIAAFTAVVTMVSELIVILRRGNQISAQKDEYEKINEIIVNALKDGKKMDKEDELPEEFYIKFDEVAGKIGTSDPIKEKGKEIVKDIIGGQKIGTHKGEPITVKDVINKVEDVRTVTKVVTGIWKFFRRKR